MIGIGVIGFGYWGPNLVRNFHEMMDSRVLAVSDQRMDRLALAASRYPGIGIMQNPSELIRSPAVDAVVIATPVSTHFQLAMEALRAGKHVLVEKPLAMTSEQSWQLIEEAERRHLILMVDHTFVYTGSVRKMKELIDAGEVGDLYYYDSVRVNLGLFQHDVNVLWDLAVHDLSIMDHLLPTRPRAVSATGMRHFTQEPENIAYLTLFYDSSLIAHIHVNWLAPVKVRRTLIGGSQKMIIYDDVEPSEKIKVYDKGVTTESQQAHSEILHLAFTTIQFMRILGQAQHSNDMHPLLDERLQRQNPSLCAADEEHLHAATDCNPTHSMTDWATVLICALVISGNRGSDSTSRDAASAQGNDPGGYLGSA
jgi:predicted dehydrogenase